MADKQYNHDLCEERHEFIPKEFTEVKARLKKVENRFIAIMTVLITNLIGVICIMGVLLAG